MFRPPHQRQQQGHSQRQRPIHGPFPHPEPTLVFESRAGSSESIFDYGIHVVQMDQLERMTNEAGHVFDETFFQRRDERMAGYGEQSTSGTRDGLKVSQKGVKRKVDVAEVAIRQKKRGRRSTSLRKGLRGNGSTVDDGSEREEEEQERSEEEDDPEERKKLKNRLNAHKFRLKKKEFISGLQNDIVVRDKLLDNTRSALGSARAENEQLKKEILLLQNALLEGRGLPAIPVLPAPMPVRSIEPTQLSARNLSLVREGELLPLAENINPTMNAVPSPFSGRTRTEPSLADSAVAGSSSGRSMALPLESFMDSNPFTIKTMDDFRMRLWARVGEQARSNQLSVRRPGAMGMSSSPSLYSAVSSDIQSRSSSPDSQRSFRSAYGNIRPHYFANSNSKSAKTRRRRALAHYASDGSDSDSDSDLETGHGSSPNRPRPRTLNRAQSQPASSALLLFASPFWGALWNESRISSRVSNIDARTLNLKETLSCLSSTQNSRRNLTTTLTYRSIGARNATSQTVGAVKVAPEITAELDEWAVEAKKGPCVTAVDHADCVFSYLEEALKRFSIHILVAE